ncbi:MAG: glycine zipper family protein [Desulfobacterales bacterium]|jgi:outer membrane lipoprotein SlyB
MELKRNLLLCFALVMLCGCATMPAGPSVMVLPEPGKPFEVFQSDDAACRQWAMQQIQKAPNEIVNQNLADGAVIGTIIGAGLGAAIGAASGNAATGAAIGAGSGLVTGTAVASGPAYAAGMDAQRKYDNAYQQCMYAKGNQIPGFVAAPKGPRGIPPPPPPGYTERPPASSSTGDTPIIPPP